jgi:hypothetical protein
MFRLQLFHESVHIVCNYSTIRVRIAGKFGGDLIEQEALFEPLPDIRSSRVEHCHRVAGNIENDGTIMIDDRSNVGNGFDHLVLPPDREMALNQGGTMITRVRLIA